jgi:hypothetical protein
MARPFKVGSKVALRDEPRFWGVIEDVDEYQYDPDKDKDVLHYSVRWSDGSLEIIAGYKLMKAVG